MKLIKEWATEIRVAYEESKAAQATPTIRSVLVDYAYQCRNRYQSKNLKYRMKCFNSTFNRMKNLVDELESRNIYRVYDIVKLISDIEPRVDSAKATLQANARRRRDIENLKKAAQT